MIVETAAGSAEARGPRGATDRVSRRTHLFVGTAIAALAAAAAAPDPAAAQSVEACGPIDGDGRITCLPDGNPYEDGIFYETPDMPVLDLTVALAEGVAVELDPAQDGLVGVDLQGLGEASIALLADPGTSVSTAGTGQIGVEAISAAGAINIEAPDIATAGDSARGINARSEDGGGIQVLARNVTTAGQSARGINAFAEAGGNVAVTVEGALTTTGASARGIVASSNNGTVAVAVGDLATQGAYADAIVAFGDDVGVTVGGEVTTAGDSAVGLYSQGGSVELVIDGSVATSGFGAGGVVAMSDEEAIVRGTGSVATSGILSRGVLVQAYDGDAIVDLSNVATTGESSSGITASSFLGESRVAVGSVSTAAGYSTGIQGFSTYGNVTISSSGAIRTEGVVSDGVRASGRGVMDVSVHDVATAGESSSAVVARGSEAHVTVTGLVRTTGDSLRAGSGAYQAAIFASASAGPDAEAPAGTVTVVNDGEIETTGFQSTGIQALGEHGVSIGGEGSIRTEGDLALGMYAASNGDISIHGGTIATEGGGATGLRARAVGAIEIVEQSVSTDGAYALGVQAATQSGDILIDVGEIATAGTYSRGLEAINAGNGTTRIAVGSAIIGGDQSTAIFIDGAGNGGVELDLGTIRTEGIRSRAAEVAVRGAEADLVLVSGSVETSGERSTGLYLSSYATAENASVSVEISSLRTTGEHSRGMDLLATGVDAEIRLGSLHTEGEESLGINVRARDVDLVVTGDVETTGAKATALNVTGLRDVMVVNEGSVRTSGVASTGIAVEAQNDIHVTSVGTVVAEGSLAAAVGATSLGGDVFVDVASVSSHGTLNRGVLARANLGDIRVTAGSVDTSGFSAWGVDARSFNGNVSVTVEGPLIIASTDADTATGVEAVATGLAEVSVADVTASGLGTRAVIAAGGDVSILLTGDIRSESFARLVQFPVVLGVTANNISADAGRSVSITNQGSIDSVGNRAIGMKIHAFGDARIAGTGWVRTNGERSNGVEVTTIAGIADLHLESIETLGNGSTALDLVLSGLGANRVTFGSISGSGSDNVGIKVRLSGDLRIEGGSLTLSNSRSTGISVTAAGAVEVDVDQLSTLGNGSRGIYAAAGSIHIALAEGSSAGEAAPLIRARSGHGPVTVESDERLSVAGAGSNLIDVQTGGPVSISVNDLAVAGAGSRGILVYSGRDASVAISGGVTGAADQVPGDPVVIGPGGIVADPALAIVDVRAAGVARVTHDGTIATTGAHEGGIAARGYSGVVVTGSGSVSTSGAGATGVYAGANTVGASIVMDEVSTAGPGARAVLARSYGSVSVDVGTATTTGDNSGAIRAEGATGVMVTADQVTTAGANSNGITAFSFGTSVVRAGSVTTTGENSTGIDASSYAGGDAVVFVSGAVSAADASGVIAYSPQGAASVSVGQGASVSAARNGVFLLSGDGSTLDNAGTITGGNAAVRARGGAATIVNRGTITGALQLTDNADIILNSGTLVLGAGTQLGAADDLLTNNGLVWLAGNVDFGDGNDRFVNNGILAFAAPGSGSGASIMALAAAAPPRSFTLAGLEGFANSGLVDLRDGVAGDALNITGPYVGMGDAALALDVDLAAPSLADRLVVGGAATGSTTIVLEPLGQGMLTPTALVLVQAGAGTSAGAFALDPGSRFEGFVEFGLVHNPAGGTFALVGAPAPTAYRLLKVTEGSQNLWHDSADAVSAHLATARDTTASGGAFWFQALGAVRNRDDTRSFTNAGFSQTVDLGYRQDDFGGQLGVDLAGGAAQADGLRFGFTGGYQNSSLSFESGPDGLSYDGFNVGAYAQLRSGQFYATGLAKFDHHEVTASLGSIGTRETFGGNAYGARIEAGFTLGSDRFYAEPSVGISYLRTDLDGLGAFGATVDFETMEGIRALAGLRLGSRRTTAAGHLLTFYGAANVVAELAGEDGLVFATGADAVRLANDPIGTHGAGTIGFSAETGPITGFIEANGVLGGDYKGGGARAGLRIAF